MLRSFTDHFTAGFFAERKFVSGSRTVIDTRVHDWYTTEEDDELLLAFYDFRC
jgi:hypothetical protein